MPHSLDSLVIRLDSLLAELDAADEANAAAIAGVDPRHRLGAGNLVRYTALRRHDRRELQHDLLDLGVTSLATSEADVRAKVQAARNVVAALRGDPGPWQLDEIAEALDRGDEVLQANAGDIFGPMRPERPTRIMVTLPSEAADDSALVGKLVEAGMDVARVNCAHDDEAAWGRMADNVRAAARAAGRQVLVSMDLPGPKVRTGPIAAGPAVGRCRVTRDDAGAVVAPAQLWLTDADAPAPPPAVVPPAVRGALAVHADPGWLEQRRPGDVITVRDARGPRRRFTVTEVGPHGVMAECGHKAFVEDGTTAQCGTDNTTLRGIPAIPGRLSLAVGDSLVLTRDLSPVPVPGAGHVARIGCTLPEAIDALAVGDPVLFDDGAIATVVSGVTVDEVCLRVTRTKAGGQRLGAQKGINLPDTVLPVPALTAEDEAALPFIAAHGDLVAVSFVRTAADIEHVLARLAAVGADQLGLVLKIETRQGFENLPAILLTAMRHPRLAVMIARGDMAVELGYERLAEVPRQILALCEAAHIPAIWATQVLETMAQTGQPSRAEITDAAAAQRAECVMLNKGPQMAAAIRTLDAILARMGQVQRKSRTFLRHIHSWDGG